MRPGLIDTGYGNQCKFLLRCIRDLGYPVACLAFWGCEGGNTEWEGIPIFGRQLDGYGNDAIPHIIKKFHADVVITLIDLWVMDVNIGRHGALWAAIVPIDHDPCPDVVGARFPHVQRLIAMAQFGERKMKEYYNGEFAHKVTYIPHSIDCAAYHPVTSEEKIQYRKKFYPDWPEDAFVCFPPDTNITLADGSAKAIAEVNQGDDVLSADGKVVTTTTIINRSYIGDLVDLRITGREPLRATPEHPILAIKRESLICDRCYSFWQRGYICRQDGKRNYTNSMCATCLQPVLGRVQAEFYRADELKVGDFALSPVLNSETKKQPLLDIAEYIKVDGRLTDTEIQGRYVKRSIPRRIPLDDAFAQLLGIYIADGNLYRRTGSTIPNGITITTGPDKTEAQRVVSLFKQVFGLAAKLRQVHCNGGGLIKEGEYQSHAVTLTHRDVAQLFYALAGEHAESKQLNPTIIHWPLDVQASLLRGMWSGDGYETKGKSRNKPIRYVYSTVSVSLAYQIMALLAIQGTSSSIRKECRRIGRPIFRISYSESALNIGRLRREHHNMFPIPGYTLHEIRKVEKVAYSGMVHNLHVGAPHTYVANGISVHNCGMVAANKGYPCRKSFPEAMEAFAMFSKDHPEARLYLHSYASTEFGGPHLIEMGKHFGIEEKLRVANPQMTLAGDYDDDLMRQLYGTMDVLLSPSQGEGFGICVVEAQAVGIPVIVTDFSAQSELVGAGWRVPPARLISTLLWSKQAEADVQGIYHALKEARWHLPNPHMSAMAREFALRYDVPVVNKQFWSPFFASLDAGRKEMTKELRMPYLDKIPVAM